MYVSRTPINVPFMCLPSYLGHHLSPEALARASTIALCHALIVPSAPEQDKGRRGPNARDNRPLLCGESPFSPKSGIDGVDDPREGCGLARCGRTRPNGRE